MQENPLVNFAKFSNQFPYYSFIQFPTNLKLETFSSNSSMLSQRLSRKDPISRFDIFLFAPSRARNFEIALIWISPEEERPRNQPPPIPLFPARLIFTRQSFCLQLALHFTPLSAQPFCNSMILDQRGEGENGFDAFANKLLLNSAGRY